MKERSNRTLPEINSGGGVAESTYEYGYDEYYYYSHVDPTQIVNEENCVEYDEELATVNFGIDDKNAASLKNDDKITTLRTETNSTRFKQPDDLRRSGAPPILTGCNYSGISNHRNATNRVLRSPIPASDHYLSVKFPIDVNCEYLDEKEIRKDDVRSVNLDGRDVKEHTFEQTIRRMNAKSFRSGADAPSASIHCRQQQQDTPKARNVRIEKDENIDYSSRSFHDAKAAISAAAQRNTPAPSNLSAQNKSRMQTSILKDGSPSKEHEHSLRFADINAADRSAPELASAANEQPRGAHMRRVGDTTIVTHYRDPYSFYWELDQVRRRDSSPPRRRFISPTIIDEVFADRDDEALEEGEPEEDEPPPVEKILLSPDSNDSGVNMESYYAKPFREPLPDGWEKHKDPSGYSYYWHVDNGVIQRDLPAKNCRKLSPPPRTADTKRNVITPDTVANDAVKSPTLVVEEHAYRQTTRKQRVEKCQNVDELHNDYNRNGAVLTHVRFAVRSLGGTELADEDLCDAERSSFTVNAALSRLSRAENDDIMRSMRWANGELMFLDIDDDMLILRNADTLDALERIRVQNIRVWGVSKENPYDFAYVTRDPQTRHFFCHVFRCDKAPALGIANALRSICARIIEQRYVGQQRPATLNVGEFNKAGVPLKRVMRESSLLMPMDEPKRIIRCYFIGTTEVPKATGINTLNEAVDRLVCEVNADRWLLADVSVAPSTILIHEATPNAPLNGSLTRPIAECRVRFLSFLGIGRDIKHCAFIMHDACTSSFLCYVFRVDPNAALMAKTIEAACKLRYQKVLDAHLGRAHSGTTSPFGPPITTTTTYSH